MDFNIRPAILVFSSPFVDEDTLTLDLDIAEDDVEIEFIAEEQLNNNGGSY